MGSWSLTGILLIVGVFVAIFTFILTQINVTNPYTNMETNAFALVIDWIIP